MTNHNTDFVARSEPVTKIVGKPIVGKPTSYAHKKIQATKRGWIEYNKSGGKRYARRRMWVRKGGKWIKTKPQRVKTIPPLTEAQYLGRKEYLAKVKEATKRD